MPADTGQVNDVYFAAIGLVGWFADPNPEFFGELFFRYRPPEFVGIADSDINHQVFGKGNIVEFLQNESTSIALKTNIITGIPVDGET